MALSSHLEALKLSKYVGTRCYFAEIFYGFGLTYQAMGELEKSHANFQEAIRLFGEMEAPRQVEKMRRAMES